MGSSTNIIDAAVRFARSNPDVLDCARGGARSTGRSIDELLTDAVARMRAAIEECDVSRLDELELG